MSNIYGAWISKSEFIPVIKEESHAEEGFKLLEKRFNRDSIHLKNNSFTIYNVMARLGYVRLIFIRDYETKEVTGYNVEYWQGTKLTKFQQDYVNNSQNKNTSAKRKIYGYEFNQAS